MYSLFSFIKVAAVFMFICIMNVQYPHKKIILLLAPFICRRSNFLESTINSILQSFDLYVHLCTQVFNANPLAIRKL